jgi:chromosome segregation ATPase
MGIFKRKSATQPDELSALRSDLNQLRERLEQTEYAKATLEDQLNSLTATTIVLSSTAQSDTAEIVEKIVMLETRLETNHAVGNKVDELHHRIIDIEQRQPSVDSYELSDITPKLAALSGRIEQVAELAAAPAQPDDELAARLDELGRSAESVEVLNRQLSLLNARVGAQSEMADQLKALSDRISLLQERSIDTDEVFQRIDAIATNPPFVSELSERVVELSSRLTANEEQQRLVLEQTARVEQRMALEQGRIQAEEVRTEMRAEIEALRAQIAAQLDEAVPSVDLFAGQLAQLAERVAANEHDSRTSRDELVGRIEAQSSAAIDLSNVHDRLSASEHDARTARETAAALEEHMGEQLGTLAAKVGALDAQTSDIDLLRQRIDDLALAAAAGDAINEQLSLLTDRLGATETSANEARLQAAAVDQRLASASTELANQVGELGREIDSLASREAAPPVVQVDPAATDALRTGQVRLASEQARFEISFREDLAVLAEQVRQLRGRS